MTLPAFETLQVEAPTTEVRWVIPGKARVTGSVTDEHGAPAARVRMRLWLEADGSLKARGTTDARGHFSLWGLSPGRYVLEAAEGSGEVERFTFHALELRERETAEVDLRLEAGWTLSGRAVDETGHPLAGVHIRARAFPEHTPSWRPGAWVHEPYGTTPSVHTGADGRFTLRNLQGREAELEVDLEGYRAPPPDELRVREGSTDLRVVLRRMARIHGRLLGPEGAPITRFGVSGMEVMDPEGDFSVPIRRSGTYHLKFSAKGMAPLLHRVPAREGTDVDMGELHLSPGRRISGRVLDAETSSPLEGAQVLTSNLRNPRIRIRSHPNAVRTDVDGTFTLPHEPSRPLQLLVEAEGYRVRSLELGGGDVDDLTVHMEQGARVMLLAKDAQGRPVAASGYLDQEGSGMELGTFFYAENGMDVLRGLEPGRYRVHAGPSGKNENHLVFPIHFVDIPATGEVSIELRARDSGATLELRLKGATTTAALYLGVAPRPIPHGSHSSLLSRALEAEDVSPGVVRFRNLPPGRATLLLVKNEAIVYLDEVDLPAEGTVVREVTFDEKLLRP
nr:carboxypeptidase regulatory-like domain-containing protein [Pyxidicoccus fallax]